MKTKFKYLVAALSLSLICTISHAQEGLDPLLFSTEALRSSSIEGPLSAPALTLPSVADFNGFGSVVDNPAAMAMASSSFLSFGYAAFSKNDQNTANGMGILQRNPSDQNGTNGLLTDLGLLYKVPTSVGSLVVGGGYTLHSNFNRTNRFDILNQNSSITDFFRLQGEESIAFDVFATDFGDDRGSFVESIFRLGQSSDEEFLGIYQTAEINQDGYLGEASFFGSTEFQKNLFIGVSVNFLVGTYRYDRLFVEEDRDNIYNLNIIDSDFDSLTLGTDIASLSFTDELESELSSISLRIGGIYKFSDNVQAGVSLLLPRRTTVEYTLFSSASSTFDDGSSLVSDEDVVFDYTNVNPLKLSYGLTLKDINNFTVSLATDYIPYSQTEIDFDDPGLLQERLFENQFIEDNFNDVYNFRGGVAYDFGKTTIRGGYSHFPSRTKAIDLTREVYSGGLSFELADEVFLDIAAQYTEYNDRSILYTYENFSADFVDEVVDEKVRRFNAFATIRFAF